MDGLKRETKGSNVLKLEDIRHKRKKKTTGATKSQACTPEVDENQPPDNVVELGVHSKLDLVEEDADTELIKTPAKRSLVSNRRFDKAKVEQIKAALADNSYKINYRRLADKFIEHERFG